MDLENIIEELKNILIADFGDSLKFYSDEQIIFSNVEENNIVCFDFDIDKNKKDLMIFLLPENDNVSNLSIYDDEIESDLTIYLIHRNDTKEYLFKKTIRSVKSLTKLLKNNRTLNNKVGDLQINNAEYYHAVEGNENIKGAEIGITIKYEQ